MKCIAIDDEPLALEIINDYCSKIDFLELLETFTSPITALQFLNSQKVDLIFSDLEMPTINGMEFIKTLPYPPKVIFTTAHRSQALEAFEIDAIDYLLKPIPFAKFLKAVNKARSRMNRHTDANSVENNSGNSGYLMVKVDYSTVKINFSDLEYVEGLKDYVKLHCRGNTYVTKSTIKNMEEKLPDNQFVRVHKSYMVSIPGTDKIENNHIYIGKQRIPIGPQYREAFYNLIEEHRL